jgi:demethylmenaquinone methyltransferase/2-methoxy-6-polyprenyl-1,4-benzoquinol methylase
VTGLDLSVPFLKQARHRAEESGLSKPISFGAGDMLRLPFGRQTFDWVWSLDCAGAVGNDPMPLIRELSRVTRSGGRIAVLIWSSQQLLPGYPLLEARLNSTAAGLAPFREGMPPETHILRMRGWLRRAGLKQVEVQTFVGDVCAPLSDPIRRAMISLFDMRWGGARSEVSSADWAQYERLCTPESPDFILDQPDYYGFFTYSLFHARAPG